MPNLRRQHSTIETLWQLHGTAGGRISSSSGHHSSLPLRFTRRLSCWGLSFWLLCVRTTNSRPGRDQENCHPGHSLANSLLLARSLFCCLRYPAEGAAVSRFGPAPPLHCGNKAFYKPDSLAAILINQENEKGKDAGCRGRGKESPVPFSRAVAWGGPKVTLLPHFQGSQT